MPAHAFTISQLDPGDVDELEPLWNALREHHAALAPEWGAPRTREDSWALRRPEYTAWLADPANFCLVARDGAGTAVAGAVVKLNGPESIWPTERSGELETLAVLPDWRSAGVGGALIAAARAELARRGLESMSIEVLHANVDGLRFYERHGFGPATHTLWGDTAPRP